MRHEQSIIDHAFNGLENITEDSIYGCDLLNYLFKQNYFITGYHQSEKWINEMGGYSYVVNEINIYEKYHFGKVCTDINDSESLVNMYAYILGEELLGDLKTLRKKWNVKLSADDLQEIKDELLRLTDEG